MEYHSPFSMQPPGTYGLMQYPLSPMQNQAPFQNMVQPVNQGNSIRGINPELSPSVPRSFNAMQLGSPYPAVPGMPYTGSYPGGLMNNRPFGNSHNPLKIPSPNVNSIPFSPGSNGGGHTQTEGQPHSTFIFEFTYRANGNTIFFQE
jgi:CUG-BP- and ETR3-like factor